MSTQTYTETRSMVNDIEKTGVQLEPVVQQSFEIKSYLTELAQTVISSYQKLPGKITNIKTDYIIPVGNENTRLIILGLSSIFSVMLIRKLNPVNGLQTSRNLIFAYMGLGLLITPEIYNPFIDYGYKYQESIYKLQ